MELDRTKVFHCFDDIKKTERYIGWKGYFANNIIELRDKVRQGVVTELKILQDRHTHERCYGIPFYDDELFWVYFYPIEP